MNIRNIFLLCLSVVLLCGCYKEDAIHVEEQHYKRVYDSSSSDPVWKYVSQYYEKYNKLLITDPDSSDYLFNFDNKYALWLQKPKQDQEHLLRAIKFIEDVFFNGYTEEFKKKMMPFKIFLADSVVYTGSFEVGKEWQPRDIYVTTNHISFSVSEYIMNITDEEKEKLSTRWNGLFLNDYLKSKTGWTAPEEFYLYSTDDEFYKNFSQAKTPWTDDDCWELGYPQAKNYSKWGQKSDGSWGMVDVGFQVASSRSSYLEQFINFLFNATPSTLERALKHARFKKAHDILDHSLKNDLGIDYSKIGFKASK